MRDLQRTVAFAVMQSSSFHELGVGGKWSDAVATHGGTV